MRQTSIRQQSYNEVESLHSRSHRSPWNSTNSHKYMYFTLYGALVAEKERFYSATANFDLRP